jgi:hypothetical protein
MVDEPFAKGAIRRLFPVENRYKNGAIETPWKRVCGCLRKMRSRNNFVKTDGYGAT